MINYKKGFLALFLLSFSAALIMFRGDLAKLCISDYGSQGRYLSRQFDSAMSTVNTLDYAKIEAEKTLSAEGITYKFKKRTGEKIIVRALKGIFYGKQKEGTLSDLSGLSITCGNTEIMKRNINELRTGNNRIEIPSNSLPTGGNFSVKLSRAKERVPASGEVIRRIEIVFLPYNGKFIPDMPFILLCIFLPVMLYFLMLNLGVRQSPAFFSGLIFILAVNSLNNMLAAAPFTFILAFLYLLSGLCFVLGYKLKKNISFVVIFLFLLIVIHAVFLRWQELEIAAFAPAHLDAGVPLAGYRTLADGIRLPFKGLFTPGEGVAIHEKMHPYIAKLFFAVFGSSDLHLRFVSFFFSVLSVIFAYFIIGNMLKNRLLALSAVFLLATSTTLIENSVYGLRTEVETFLLMAFFFTSFIKRSILKDRPFVWALFSGICGSLLILVRNFYFFPVLFVLIYSFLNAGKISLKHKAFPAIFALIIIILPCLFWRIQIFNKHHSWTWDQDMYARITASHEFNDTSLVSKPIKLYGYLFRMHSFSEIVRNSFLGIFGAAFFLNEYAFNITYIQNNFVKQILAFKLQAIKNHFLHFLIISATLSISCGALLHIIFNKRRRVLFWVIGSGIYYSVFFIGCFVYSGTALISMDRAVIPLLPFFLTAILSFLQTGYRRIFSRWNLL